MFAPGETLHAPHILDVEVAQVLRRIAGNRDMDEQRGREAISDLAALPIRRYAHDFLLPRIWQLRHNFSAYDGAYVALAEVLEATLLTRDRRLASAAGRYASVEVV